jgi:hypothetical protein
VFGDPAAACHDFAPALLANTSVFLSIKVKQPENRSGERWMRSPDLLPFGWRYRYFFFAAFFAAFFAGAFLAAFLVAICLFSLVTILFRPAKSYCS